jgi:tetratricopeptide (TPR) repeat protein
VKIAALATAGLGFALLLAPALAGASDESDVLRARAVRLVREGNCEQALPLLQRALDADPREARAGLLAGRCLIAKRRYAEAENALQGASARDPELPGVALQLAVARYHLDDLAGARSALETARAESAGDAQFELYDALLLTAEDRRSEALTAFERARAADARRVEPMASYFEGMAAGRARQQARAQAALERVAAQDPDGPWGAQARQQLDQMGRGPRGKGWIQGSLGFEWDSNAVLLGEGVELPDEYDRESDARLVWRGNAGIEALRTLDWSGGAMLTYTGSHHDDLEDFNYHYPIGSLWIDRHLSEKTTAHLQYDAGHAFVDNDSWLTSHNLAPALHHDWGNGQQSRLFGRVYLYDFRFDRIESEDPADVSYRNRDGHGVGVGVEHMLPVKRAASDLRAGVLATSYSARGSEYSHKAVDTWLGTRTQLPAQLVLTMRAGFTYRPYIHRTSFEDPGELGPPPGGKTSDTRRDHANHFEVGLERPLSRSTSAELRWRWVDNRSNVDVFDYDRSILGAYVNVRFD